MCNSFLGYEVICFVSSKFQTQLAETHVFFCFNLAFVNFVQGLVAHCSHQALRYKHSPNSIDVSVFAGFTAYVRNGLGFARVVDASILFVLLIAVRSSFRFPNTINLLLNIRAAFEFIDVAVL